MSKVVGEWGGNGFHLLVGHEDLGIIHFGRTEHVEEGFEVETEEKLIKVPSFFDVYEYTIVTNSGLMIRATASGVTPNTDKEIIVVPRQNILPPATIDLSYEAKLAKANAVLLEKLHIPYQFGPVDTQKKLVYAVSSKQEKGTVEILREILPGHDSKNYQCPAGDDYSLCDRNDVWYSVIHLNDYHEWTREQIADWIETLDEDFTFPIGEENEHQD